MRTNLEEALWIPQEADYLAQFRLGLVNTCHIGEGGGWAFFFVQPGAAATDAKDSTSLVLHLAQTSHTHEPKVEQQEQGQCIQEQCQRRLPPWGLHQLSPYFDPLFLKQGQQTR